MFSSKLLHSQILQPDLLLHTGKTYCDVVAPLVLVGRAGGNQQWRAALPTGESRPTIPTPVSFRLLPAPTPCLQLLAYRDQLTLRVFYLPELPRLPLSGSSSFCSGAGVKPHLAPTSLLCL